MFSDILLTVDFDRTLTAPDSSIPRRNIEAIEYFIANGGTFTVNSGRCVPMFRKVMNAVPMNAPYLGYNGSAWYNVKTGKLERAVEIDLDPAALIEDIQSHFPGVTIENQAVNATYLFRENRHWEALCENAGAPWAYTTPDRVERPFMKLAVYTDFVSDTVASMYDATAEQLAEMERVINYITKKYGDQLALFLSCPRILDIHAAGCSKLSSARALQKKLGKKILVCVGDAENDLNMLQGADYAYCPADGIVADRFENVCACAEGAVADVIYKKLPALLK